MPSASEDSLRRSGRSLAMLVYCGLPIAVAWSLAETMRHALGAPFTSWGLTLFLAGVGAAYTVDRLIDPPQASNPPPLQGTLWKAAILFAGLTLFAALQMPHSLQAGVFILSAISLAYPRLKHLPLAKTAAIALAWTWASATLPFAGAGRLSSILAIPVPLFLMIAANAILCDLKDRERDRQNHVPTLPVLLGPLAACRIATGILLISIALSASSGALELALPGAALALAAQFPALLSQEILGPLIADALLILPGLLIWSGTV